MAQDISTVGARIQMIRAERGLTQAELAGRAGISEKMVSLIERGKRRPGMASVYALADALDVEPSRLLDRRDRMEARGPDRGILAVRDALMVPGDIPGLDLADDGPPAPLERLEDAVDTGWELYWLGRLTDLASLLPPLLRSARATEREIGQAACRPLAQAYQLAADLMVHVGNDDLAFGGAMRAMRTAARGDDPLQQATLAGTVSWILLHQGRLAFAEQVAAAAAKEIRPSGRVSLRHLNVYGALLLSAAAPAAAARNRDAVEEYMGEARVAALRFTEGDQHDYNVSFGLSQMAQQETHQFTVMHKAAAAIDAAGRVNRADLLHLSYGALHLDVTQAYLELKELGPAVDALWTAWEVSPQWAAQQGAWRDSLAAAVMAERRAGRAQELARVARLHLGVSPSVYAGRLSMRRPAITADTTSPTDPYRRPAGS